MDSFNNETGNLELVTASRSTQLTIGSTEDERSRRAGFSKALSPALILVAPTGMSGDERKAWLAAADVALSDYDNDVLAVAAKIAMRKADHPRYLVPMIIDAAEAEILRRETEIAAEKYRAEYLAREQTPVLEIIPISDEERAEVADMVSKLARKLSAKHG